jgi:cystathionine beta-lyase
MKLLNEVTPLTSRPLFDFDTPIDRRGTASLKWDRYADNAVLPLWVADMDFAAPPAVLDALRERIAHPVFGYTVPPPALTETVVDLLGRRFDWNVAPESIIWLPGLVAGLNACCRAVGDAGDAVLTAVPVYPPFLTAPGHARRRLQTVPVRNRTQNWSLDLDRLAAAVAPDTRLFILCNPHNPTGRVYSRQEMEGLADICLRNDIIVCADEIHCDLILDRDKPHRPFAAMGKEIARRTITLMAPSKTYNLPGLGCAYAVITNPDLRRIFKNVMAGIVPGVNLFGFTATLAAYRHGSTWLAALINYLRQNRETVLAAVERMPGLSVHRPEATYLAWIDTRPSGLEDPARFFEAAGVGLNDGANFAGPGFVRLNFGCPRSVLAEALRRMGRAMERLAAEKGIEA